MTKNTQSVREEALRKDIAMFFYNADYPQAYSTDEIAKYEEDVDKVMAIFKKHATQAAAILAELEEEPLVSSCDPNHIDVRRVKAIVKKHLL